MGCVLSFLRCLSFSLSYFSLSLSVSLSLSLPVSVCLSFCVSLSLALTPRTHANRKLQVAVSVMLDGNIAHNLFMTRGPPLGGDTALADQSVVRALLIPRHPVHGGWDELGVSPCCGCKLCLSGAVLNFWVGLKEFYSSNKPIPPFFAAACELVGGFIPIIGELYFRYLINMFMCNTICNVACKWQLEKGPCGARMPWPAARAIILTVKLLWQWYFYSAIHIITVVSLKIRQSRFFVLNLQNEILE